MCRLRKKAVGNFGQSDRAKKRWGLYCRSKASCDRFPERSWTLITWRAKRNDGHYLQTVMNTWKFTAPKTFYTSIQFLLGRSLHAQCKTLVSDLKQKWNVSTNGGKFRNIKFHSNSTVFVLSHGHSHRPRTAKSCSFAIPFTYMPKISLGKTKKINERIMTVIA